MKRLDFLGALFFISGILLYGIVHLAIANYVPNMGGWSTPPGKFAIARDDTMLNVPYFLSIILIIVGSIILFLKELKAFINKFDN
ncbi:hypothetical protein HNQ94_001047 [Salirhabdus euzebyi]|uniref:Uncharacterized protein n=1 Tax=Salirhabdus euzebyi TaxID=394506 RepID=A0A841PZ80_9BACI|nr:hypothetical protein [Salirhabdus euzebyi]MBB6452601.1 hypothetical protein [Salirhabdus euzebyi]